MKIILKHHTMNGILRFLVFAVLLVVSTSVWAGSSSVFKLSVNKPISKVYPSMITSLKKSPFYLFYEMNIGKNLAYFSKNWGEDYNKNDLTAIRSIIFCNGSYTNQVSNKDPRLLALCPLHITLIEKGGKTTAFFTRPTVIAKGSPAHYLFVEMEKEVIKLIRRGMR